jgi:hypothetical protein
LDTSLLSPADAESEKEEKCISPIHIPANVVQAVEMPLNVLPNGKLIFVDRSFWVCSWPLRSTNRAESFQRFFSVPRNWVPLQNLDLLHVTANAGILCPRKGGLAVIRSNVSSM